MPLGGVKFERMGPFYLRAVEHDRASVLENTIQLTIFGRIAERGQSLETQMTPGAAEELANALLRAANKTEREIGG